MSASRSTFDAASFAKRTQLLQGSTGYFWAVQAPARRPTPSTAVDKSEHVKELGAAFRERVLREQVSGLDPTLR